MKRRTRTRSIGLAIAVSALPALAHAEPITAEEALRRAVGHSPELRAALADLDASRASVLSAELARTPVLYAGLDGRYAESFSDTSEGATRNSTQQISGEVGVRTATDIGTQIKVGLTSSSRWQRVNRDPTSATEVVLGPTIAADLGVDVTQPLLRGSGTNAVLAGLRQARLSRDASELARQKAGSQLALDTMRAYWQLWVAERTLGVERSALELNQRQLADITAKAKLGTAAAIDTLRLQSEEAARKQSLAEAEADVADRQIALGRLLGLTPSASLELSASSLPEQSPAALAERPSLDELVSLAADQSFDIAQLDLSIEQAKERMGSAADLARPKLDLWSTVGLGGLWTEEAPAGLSLPGGRPAITALIGLDFELPLGESSADANLAEARANLEGAKLRKEARLEQLTAEVATARRALDTARTSAENAAITAKLAGMLAEKEDQKLRLGTSLLTELVSAQQSYRSAELSRLRALANTALAALELDHLTGQLLSRLTIQLETTR